MLDGVLSFLVASGLKVVVESGLLMAEVAEA